MRRELPGLFPQAVFLIQLGYQIRERQLLREDRNEKILIDSLGISEGITRRCRSLDGRSIGTRGFAN